MHKFVHPPLSIYMPLNTHIPLYRIFYPRFFYVSSICSSGSLICQHLIKLSILFRIICIMFYSILVQFFIMKQFIQSFFYACCFGYGFKTCSELHSGVLTPVQIRELRQIYSEFHPLIINIRGDYRIIFHVAF